MLTRAEIISAIRNSKHPFYVYLLVDDMGQPFYVGKGTSLRCLAHEAEALNSLNDTEKHRVIRRLWESSNGVRYIVAGYFQTDDEAHDEERQLIQKHGRRNKGTGILCNLSDGGEGNSREYPPEPFERDENGIPIGKQLNYPNPDQLRPPRFMRYDLPQYKSFPPYGVMGLTIEDAAIIEAEQKKPSGMKMSTIAFWQHAGWTVQVFWDQTQEFNPHEVAQNGRAECVSFRFFDNTKLLLVDRLRATAITITNPERIIARILNAMATAHEIKDVHGNLLHRACANCSSVDLTKRLQAWCFHQQKWLRFFADNLTAELESISTKQVISTRLPDKLLSLKPTDGITITDLEFHKLLSLAWSAFIKHGLGENQFTQLYQEDWRGLVLYDWAGLDPIDASFVDFSSGLPIIRADLNKAKLSRMQLISHWNQEFPSMKIPLTNSKAGPAFMEREIRGTVRMIADMHRDLSE